MRRRPLGWPAVTFGLAGAALLAAPAVAQQQKVGAPPEAMNTRLVGYNDLQARSAYQPTIHKQGDRYIAYIGHHGGTDDVPKPMNKVTGQPEFNGTSILDVTDPSAAVVVQTVPAALFPREVTVGSDGTTLYLTNYTSKTLQVISTSVAQ